MFEMPEKVKLEFDENTDATNITDADTKKYDSFQWPLGSVAACQLQLITLKTLHTASQLGPYGCEVQLSCFLVKEIKQFLTAEMEWENTFRDGKVTLGQLKDEMVDCCLVQWYYDHNGKLVWNKLQVFPELLLDHLFDEVNDPRCNIVHLQEKVPYDYVGVEERSKVYRNALKGLFESKHRMDMWLLRQQGKVPRRYVVFITCTLAGFWRQNKKN